MFKVYLFVHIDINIKISTLIDNFILKPFDTCKNKYNSNTNRSNINTRQKSSQLDFYVELATPIFSINFGITNTKIRHSDAIILRIIY